MSSFQEFDMSHITTGEHMMITADHAIQIAVGTTATAWEGSAVMLAGASITHVYLKNTNTTNTCTVDVVVTD